MKVTTKQIKGLFEFYCGTDYKIARIGTNNNNVIIFNVSNNQNVEKWLFPHPFSIQSVHCFDEITEMTLTHTKPANLLNEIIFWNNNRDEAIKRNYPEKLFLS